MTWPDEFIWGTTSSSIAAEGAAPASDWARFEQLGRVPSSGRGNGFAERYEDDVALLAAAGLDAHRLTLDWARIEPQPGRRDDRAIEHYLLVLDAAERAGIAPWVCLHHFSLPGWFGDDEGGFRRDPARGRYLWSAHVDFVAETFGDRVAGWMPIHEPVAYATTVARRVFPPSETTTQKLAELIDTMHLAAADAARILRGGRGPVATVHNLHLPYRVDDRAETIEAAKLADRIWWGWNRPELLEPFDLLGFTYEHCVQIDADGAHHPFPPGSRVGPLGIAPWAEGLGHVLRRLAEHQALPILVAELAIATDDEQWRSVYLEDALGFVAEACADDIDVRGCFFAGIDGPAPGDAPRAPTGLFDVDRTPRPALDVVRQAMAR